MVLDWYTYAKHSTLQLLQKQKPSHHIDAGASHIGIRATSDLHIHTSHIHNQIPQAPPTLQYYMVSRKFSHSQASDDGGNSSSLCLLISVSSLSPHLCVSSSLSPHLSVSSLCLLVSVSSTLCLLICLLISPHLCVSSSLCLLVSVSSSLCLIISASPLLSVSTSLSPHLSVSPLCVSSQCLLISLCPLISLCCLISASLPPCS